MATTRTSYPRTKIKVLLLENISPSASREMAAAGYTEVRHVNSALDETQLIKAVKGVHLLGIRSKTQITKNVLDAADKLLAIGCFCIGVNQVDLKSATEHGIAVFNAPYSNTRSVAELIIGLCVVLIRKIAEKNEAAHRGIWLKDAKGSFELRGKTLGIVGYGNIGSQVSIMAEALGVHVVYFDISTKLPHGNAKQVRDLKELVSQSDIVTLHVPSNATTQNMIDADILKSFKKGSILLNYSRGDDVDLGALKKTNNNGHLSGGANDVITREPEKSGDTFSCELQNLPNVILTPHIGGSTEEAQANIGLDVTSKLIKYLELGTSEGSHTVPPVSLPPQAGTHRILHIHRNVPGVLGEINSRLSSRGINIVGQYLNTNAEIGYVILDIESKLSKQAFSILRDVPGTLRSRIVY
jgi:D-3-phosphoglycerate dehydrogenase